MARQRAFAVLPRVFKPSYCLRRPRRLLALFAFFVCSTVFLWDRHNLVVNHEETTGELARQNDKLEREFLKLSKLLKEKGETLPKELELKKLERSVSESTGGHRTGLFDFFFPTRRKPPVIDVDKDPVAAERRDKVRDAMLHAWTCYERYAWGMDELKPRSKTGENQFAGLGATIIDSLDTLYIMGFQKQFEKARDWVAENLNFNQNVETSVFETTIRVLGGLLSAYDLSGEPMFLRKAQEIADRLMPAWDSPSGIPYSTINLATGHARNPSWSGGASILADLGTEQVELIALSQRTGSPKYKEKAERVIKQLRKVFPSDGLLSYYINPDSGQPNSDGVITFGGMGDSFYEYLLKVWIQGNRTEVVKYYREMWEQSMEGMKSLVFRTTDGYTYLAEKSGRQVTKKMDELACFVPGMLVLGMEGASPENAKEYLNLAEELAKTCYNMYMSTPTKLAGENYNFDSTGMNVGASWNILRPETVESFMYLWRKTRNQKYRDWGWDIFLGFEAQSRIPTGYVGLKDVNSGEKDDKMQSFFLAETLKYLYLLFSPSTVLPLEEWVFNTEAHPVRIVARVGEPISLEDETDVHKRGVKPTNQAEVQRGHQQRWKGRGNSGHFPRRTIGERAV